MNEQERTAARKHLVGTEGWAAWVARELARDETVVCASCRSSNDVRNGFCRDCMDSVAPVAFPELYIDLGGGD